MCSGKFTHEEIAPKGTLKKEQLSCDIQRIDGHGDFKVKSRNINSLNGMFSNMISFGSHIKKLTTRYTFLDAITKFIAKHTAKAASAPTIDTEVNSHIQTDLTSKLSGQPASDVTIKHPVSMVVKAKLVSYFRAPINYVRKLVFVRVANLLPCDTTLSKSIRTLPLTRTSKITKGTAKLARSIDNTFHTGTQAQAESAPSTVPTLDLGTGTSHEANAIAGGGADVVIDTIPAVSHTAKLAFWFYPEVVDGDLILKQAYGAVQNNYELEVT